MDKTMLSVGSGAVAIDVRALSATAVAGSGGPELGDRRASQPSPTAVNEQLAYWIGKLQGVAAPMPLPTDRPRSASARYTTDSISIKLSTSLTKRLRNLARRKRVSLFTMLLSGWAIMLSRRSGQEDVVISVSTLSHWPSKIVPSLECTQNTVALRLSVRGDATVEQLLKEIEASVTEAHDHQSVSLEEVIPALQSTVLLKDVLQVSMGLNAHAAGPRIAREHASTTSDGSSDGITACPEISLWLEEGDGHLNGAIEYARELFDPATIDRMAASWKMLLRGMVKHVHRLTGQLGMLTATERQQVLYRNNATAAEFPGHRLIHELFEEQVRQCPAAVALVCRDQSLTYAELNRRANKLARYLRRCGVDARDRVAICTERSVDTVVAILGVLKSGAAYVPVDHNYPAERLAYLLEDASPAAVLTQAALKIRLPATPAAVILIDAQWPEVELEEEGNLAPIEITSEDLAYVMYTSGSTGQPKGVMVRHRNVVNYATHAVREFDIESGAGSLIGTSMSFDLALTGFFPPLICGRAIRVCAEDEDLSQALLCGWNYAPVKLTPTHLSVLSLPETEIDGRIRALVVGGEQLQGNALRWWRKHSPGTRIFNHYGPTETTIGCVIFEVREDLDGPVPIGRPISNAQIYILNPYHLPVPIGVIGEIYIGGKGVAAGYWQRPELTAERFLSDPFTEDPDARMYRTGDLGRWRADGTIEYLGRNDDQVKIRGFRIELGEIGARLIEHPAVKEAAVLALEDTLGEKRLVAYVTARGAQRPSVETLRSHLTTVLPHYMVPSAYVVLDRLPLTANGKLDKRALPAPDASACANREYEPPQGELERTIAALWEELLRVERVGRRDNFFELGGHSLVIVRMMDRLRRMGLSAGLRSVYQSPTLQGFVCALNTAPASRFVVPPNRIALHSDSITPDMLPLLELGSEHIARIVDAVPGGARNIQDVYPLAPLQEGILFHHLLHEQGGDTYLFPMLLSVASRRDLTDLVGALQTVIDRHDSFRTAVLWEHLPQPVQVVYRAVTLPVEEIVLDKHRDVREQLEAHMAHERQRLDLTRAPLLRLLVAADPHGPQWYAILQVHHIVSDHETTTRMLLEVARCLRGEVHMLAPAKPFRDHVARARMQASSSAAETFFRTKLADIDESTAPFGLLDVRGGAGRLAEAQETLDPSLARRLGIQARRCGVSAATLFHAAWALLVSHTSGRDDVVFGTVLLGRMDGANEVQDVLGMFINTLPLRIGLRGLTARTLVERTQRELVELIEYEQISLAVAQRCSGIGGSAPLFSALLNYVHGTSQLDAEHGRIGPAVQVLARRKWTNYPIVVSIEDRSEGYVLTAQTDRRIDPRRLTTYLGMAARSLVAALEEAPDTPALRLRVLPDDELRQVLDGFNARRRTDRSERAVHEAFEDQVRRMPNAIAATYESDSVTYLELNGRANQLARYLCQQGVERGERIVILMERCLAQVIAQLAILKCGAVYVPVDPKLPAQRQMFMIRDCSARRVLVDADDYGSNLSPPAQWISYSAAMREAASLPAHNLEATQIAPQPAYVMYTSGSTGTPKGVIIPQQGVVGLVVDNGYTQIGSDDCVAYGSNPTFDASTLEVWGALLNGARLLILPQAVVLDAERLAETVQRNRVTVMFLTVGLFNQHADVLTRVFPQMRYAMTGGDVVDPAVLRRVLRNGRPQHLLNAYGPTECTTISTTFEVDSLDEEATSIPIGRPVANAAVYILNTEMMPVPIGTVGEIYIGGAGVALGYLNRPELTAERFLPNPFGKDVDARLYKTGDLGRWRPDGNIEFIGRNDQQVKIRGYRIELGEIETRLRRHEQVNEAIVMAREDVPGHKRLVAYVTPDQKGTPVAEALRDYLSAQLPEYMVPSAFVVLPQLPLTPNGKLNRRALPVPDADAYVSRQYEPPEGEIEEIVAGIWRELLRLERIGRHDHFFELGGHSLLAMQVIGRIRSLLSLDVAIGELFDHPMLDKFAARVEQRREELLMERLANGGTEIDELLEQVASMPEHEVHRVMSQLRDGVRL